MRAPLAVVVLILLVVLAVVVIAARGAARRAPVRGGATGATLYHGSTAELAELSPRPSAVLDGESAVFATPNMDDALMFIGKWTGCDISYGTYGGEPYAIELNPGAFRALQTPGWLYTVDARAFGRDPRLGLETEYISRKPVPVLTKTRIDSPLETMKRRRNIKFVTFDTMMSRVAGPPRREKASR